MLKREQQLRLSPETQALYGQVEVDTSDKDWIDVTKQLQRRVVREFAPGAMSAAKEQDGLEALRAAAQDPSVPFTPLYVQHQRARRGDLREGGFAPDCTVLTRQGRRCRLLETVGERPPTALLAGSYS